MRAELARKIAAHTPSTGKNEMAIPGFLLYRRTAPTPCYPASYEPSLLVLVQGRKRVIAAKTTYLCDESNFQLSSVQVPLVSQIVEASEEVPLLAMFLSLDMAAVREILAQSLSPNPFSKDARVRFERVALRLAKRRPIY